MGILTAHTSIKTGVIRKTFYIELFKTNTVQSLINKIDSPIFTLLFFQQHDAPNMITFWGNYIHFRHSKSVLVNCE